ncbi:unnamed protein product [Miscanthus lutarioriparius]|uniref:Uncharacterized protein n=1 Tax=Miscanthus lutarioriparius TaxID=422564 RepID=A0A811QHF7_9POAL|nr:unnamed protein product [Miscanthus lutarioriparius]
MPRPARERCVPASVALPPNPMSCLPTSIRPLSLPVAPPPHSSQIGAPPPPHLRPNWREGHTSGISSGWTV